MHKSTKKVLEVITESVNTGTAPPTLRELAKKSGFSSTWPVRYHLKKLAEEGFIKMKKNLSRSIELTTQQAGIPLLGRISAGLPIYAAENVERHIHSVVDIFGVKDMFALSVKGDSMINAGILDGDIVFVRKQPSADEGEIVAALIGEEATVKRFYRSKDGVKLVAENPNYKPILSKEAVVMGKVVGVMRKC